MSFDYILYLIPLAVSAAVAYLVANKVVAPATLQKAFDYTKILVHAAEEAFPEGTAGREKADFVVAQVLDRFKITDEEALALVNAAVSGLRLQGIKPAKPQPQTLGVGTVAAPPMIPGPGA